MQGIKTIHLQGIGRTPAKQAQEFSVGDRMMWNYGSTSLVEAIKDASASFLVFTLVSERGERSERRLMKSRLVAVAPDEISGEA